MPNHVRNQIYVIGDDREHSKIREIAEYVKIDDSYLGTVDFNKLIPMPESLDIEASSIGEKGLKLYSKYILQCAAISTAAFSGDISPEQKRKAVIELAEQYEKMKKDDPALFELGERYYNNIQKYGCPTWYEWCTANWGTKWNAYDCTPMDKNSEAIEFNTAWDRVDDILCEISEKFLEIEIRYRWADENLGFNVGEEIFQFGDIQEENIPVNGSKEAYEMAADIRGISLKEYGMYYSENSGSYEYQEDMDEMEL